MKAIIATAHRSGWEQALVSGEYTQSTIDSTLAQVGFIHCSFPDQALDTVNRKYVDQADLVFLFVDPEKVKVEIKYEAAPSGRPGIFPHIYGPLNTDAVFAVVPIERGFDGKFLAPRELDRLQ